MRAAQTKTDIVSDVMSNLEAGGDLRQAIARLNAKIVDFQKQGQEVPGRVLRLSKALATECAAQSQGR